MKNRKSSILILVLVAGLICSCQNQDTEGSAELSSLNLLRGDIILCGGKQFGEVNFALSCKPEVREPFNLALSLLHSFEYDEAERAFVKVMDVDPNCAMAYWGVAMSIYHALWANPGEAEMLKAAKILKVAESIPKSEREAEYLEAIGLYYKDWEKIDAKKRALRMAEKMESIYKKYPEDTEAAILYALTLNSTADPTDKTYMNQRKAGSILESIFIKQPNHPGIAHYIIHNYDNPVLASQALTVARKYAKIAPSSAHAQHMPSHIFTRLGLWDESIGSNLNSTASALCYAEGAGFNAHWDEELHGMDYLVYAYLQEGNNRDAVEVDSYLKTIEKVFPENFKDAYAIAAIPARIALENKDWKLAAMLQLSPITFPWSQFPWQKSIFHFAKALGACHLKDVPAAEKQIGILQSLQLELKGKENSYEAKQVLIQIKVSQGMLAYAKGNDDTALELMHEAADMEDGTNKHPVTPCEVIPARELLADLLLDLDKPREALIAYENDLSNHPGRFNGIYGAARASQRAGQLEQSRKYYEELLLLSQNVDQVREEVKEAREFLNKI